MIQLVGQYLAQFTRSFIAQYCTPTEEKTEYQLVTYAEWSGGSFGNGKFIACCNTGIRYMFELALGIELLNYGMVNSTSVDVTGLGNSPYWEDVTNEALQPGDLVINSEHVEMYLGDNQNANFGNSPYAGKITTGPRLGSEFTKAYRLSSSVDVTPTGTLPSVSGTSSVNLSNFYFNGIPDGKYSVAHTSIWTFIIESLSQIVDYLVGLITYLIRMPFIGWAAIMDNLLNWTVQTINDTETTSDDLGISSIEVESADDEDRLTIDGLLYNDFDLTNINIFE